MAPGKKMIVRRYGSNAEKPTFAAQANLTEEESSLLVYLRQLWYELRCGKSVITEIEGMPLCVVVPGGARGDDRGKLLDMECDLLPLQQGKRGHGSDGGLGRLRVARCDGINRSEWDVFFEAQAGLPERAVRAGQHFARCFAVALRCEQGFH